MAVGAAIAIGLIVGAVLSLYIISQMPTTDMEAAGLEDFQSTSCNEGSVVPVIFGKVKIAGNILWYGNLETKEIKEDGLSFLGMKITDDVVTGYEYYMDVWQAICIGQVDIEKVYINDKPQTLANFQARCKQGYVWNDGTGPENPQSDMPGGATAFPYATALRGFPTGVAHFFMDKYYIGDNVAALPTVHWVVDKTSTAPIYRSTGFTHPNIANLSNGTNPAAVIYELLIMGGAQASEIDALGASSSFSLAGTYWETKGYGLNLVLDSQKEVREHIQAVFAYVDGCLTQNDTDGKYYLKAFKDDGSETPADTIDTEDFISFKFSRSDWADTFNYFKATFNDEDQEFTSRTIGCMNPANESMLGYKRPKSVDLKAYRDVTPASKRLWEIMKRESYPGATIEFTTNMEFTDLTEGDLVTINNTDYGIASAEFRIMERGLGNVDDNQLTFSAVQDVPGLMDDYYEIGGDPQGVDLDLDVLPLMYQKAFEMPFFDQGHGATWLFLGARRGNEVGMRLMVSTDGGTNYYTHKIITTFAQQGELDATYPITYEIDDETGILFTPYREDPVFEQLSRAQLFNVTRLAIIDNEVMGFQYVTPEGSNQFRLEGVLRGLFNTDIVSHSGGSVIWLTQLGSNMTSTISASSFKVKMLPYIGSEIIDAGDASAITCTVTNKAATPWPPARIQAVRSGTQVTVDWWPTTQDSYGAGWKDGSEELDSDPLYDGDFWFSVDLFPAHNQAVVGTQVVFNEAGSFYANVKARSAGYESTTVTVLVGASDGTYIGPNI